MNKKRKIVIILFVIIIALAALVLSNKYESGITKESNLPEVEKSLLDKFKEVHKEEIITYAQNDLNNDGKNDLLVIYKVNKNSNKMTVVVNENNELYLTEPVPAPIEDQKIEFKDIDDKDEMEVIVSGSKNGNVGYAIYRIEDKKLVDLFGQDMESCC